MEKEKPLKKEVDIICPACKKKWGRLKVVYEKALVKEQVTVNSEYKHKKYFTDQGFLVCPNCTFMYTIFEVWKMIAQQV